MNKNEPIEPERPAVSGAVTGSWNPAVVNHGDVSRTKIEERMRKSPEGTTWIEITHPVTTEEISALVEYLKTLADTKQDSTNSVSTTTGSHIKNNKKR
jgi:hypothetical protein